MYFTSGLSLCVPLDREGSFKVDGCYDLIAWQVRYRLIPQPILGTQEMSWIVLCFFVLQVIIFFCGFVMQLFNLVCGGVFLEAF